ncbi:complement C1q tumor necrosis factor-related protein 5-like [Ptychodera flava]|uniref:complement C1q tumor necrosis factor-related protein 5-like n=1 Tax=Ptychodera flava TaxID=63121 RepID=UPI00396A7422
MKLLKHLSLFIWLQCCIIATLYQLSTCLAEEQTVNSHSGIQQSESQDFETGQSQTQQCTNSIHGIPGVPGIPGSNGPVGPVGPPGLKGQDGQIGRRGSKGDTGPPGHNGEKGSPGPKGHSGHPGPPGQQGQKGSKGQPGEVLQHPSRMAFSAAKTSSMGQVSSETTVIYNRVISNVGNGYNTSTGKFTCTVSGVYFFMISASSYTSSNLYLCLMKNSQILACVMERRSSSGLRGSACNSVIIELQDGDEVWVRLGSGHALFSDGNKYTTFTGYLLYQNS